MSVRVAKKAPADVVDYTVTFTGLGTAVIDSISVSGSGITIASPSPTHTDDQVLLWVSGGTAGTSGNVTIEITTDTALVLYRIIEIPIELL